ncbi:MAG: YgiT-type zinc finger protein [Candidatus Sumerlaeaceae bacterium]
MKAKSVRNCPTCNDPAMKLVIRDLRRSWKGISYVVPGLQFWECQKCGEVIFSPEAVRQIEAVSPAYQKKKQPTASGRIKVKKAERVAAHRSGR